MTKSPVTPATVALRPDEHRALLAIQYFNASEEILRGLKRQQGSNDFHFLISLRSFIEYTRRGIWFLVWATEAKVKNAAKLTFKEAGSPQVAQMDRMLNEALGEGDLSHLNRKVKGINEPFFDCLHALTHGNPISCRMMAIGLDGIFNTAGLLARAEMELGIFRILLYRHMAGEKYPAIWKRLGPVRSKPDAIKAEELSAANDLKKSGSLKKLSKLASD